MPRAPPQPGAGRVPDRHQGRAAASSAGVPRAATYAANSGSTSPCRAQSSRVAESRVVRSRVAADGGRHVVGQAVGRDEHGQPAAEDVVAEGCEAAAVADEPVQQVDIDLGRESEGGEPSCGRSGGPRLRNRRARRPKDSAEIDPGHANIHESSDAEGVAGQIQGPALNIGAGGAGGENRLGRHARDLRGQAQGAGHLGGPRERRRRRSGRPPRRTARRATGAAPGPVRPARSAGARRRVGGAPADHASGTTVPDAIGRRYI